MLSFVQKIIFGTSNLDHLCHLFSIARQDRYDLKSYDHYDLRSYDNMLLLPKPNTNAMKKSFSYRAAVVWNVQPLEDKIYEL